jgi:hypothetical protein
MLSSLQRSKKKSSLYPNSTIKTSCSKPLFLLISELPLVNFHFTEKRTKKINFRKKLVLFSQQIIFSSVRDISSKCTVLILSEKMKTNLIINLLIIVDCCAGWSNAQQFAYNLDRRLRQYIDEKKLFETYDFSQNYALGDPCLSSATQREGICRPIEDCRRSVEKFLQTNELEDICRFSRRRGNIAVCCVRRGQQGQNNFNQQPAQFGPNNNVPPSPAGVGEIQQIATTTTTTMTTTTTTTTPTPVTVPASPITSNRKSFLSKSSFLLFVKLSN